MVKRLLAISGLCVLVVIPTWAQDTANVVGTVRDSTGAVIPNAKVTVANPDRGFTRESMSNTAGEYTQTSIPIGNYVVTAEAAGFQKLVRSGITLQVGQTLRVDLELTVGQLTQEVTVTGNVAKVETETAAVSDVITGRQIENLNLNGRNVLGLTMLVPGAIPDTGAEALQLGHSGATTPASFSGARAEYSNLEIDGGNNSDEGSGANGGDTTPALESIAEFRISTSTYGADVGQHAGAIIEIVTKGGTKKFHGNAHEFVRNDVFDANAWFLNQQINPPGGHAPKQPLKWNTFGYNIGGPFYIPGHYNTSKTKTFFFWTQEWAKYRAGSVTSGRVPTMRMRQGDFSECDPASPNFNPTLADQGCVLPDTPLMVNDIIPVDPNAQALLNALIPEPNSGFNRYVAARSRPTNFRQEQIRVDHNISEKASVFVRFTNDAWRRMDVPSLWSGSDYDTTATDFDCPARSAVLHLSYSFKPNLMNEFVMGYADDPHFMYPLAGPGSPAHSVNKTSGWNVTPLFPPNATSPLLPGISISGGASFGAYVTSGNYPYFNANPIYTWKEKLAWVTGKHTLKFGFFLEKFQKNESFGSPVQGSLTFDGSSPISTGNALADMYLGRITQYTEGSATMNGIPVGGYGKGHWRMTQFDPYIQDDWKVTRKLTLNLGLRYYLFVPIHDVTRPTIDSNFIPSLYSESAEALLDANGNLVKDPATGHIHDFTSFGNGIVQCGAGGQPNGCQHGYYNTLSPRFGFAYDPWGTGKTVIRGGYGLYFEPGNGNEANTEGLEGNPPSTQSPSGYDIIGYQSITPGAYGPTGGLQSIPPYQKSPSVQQFSLGIQHEFPGSNVLGVSWVGSLGRHLARNRDLNQIPIGTSTKNAPPLAGLVGTVAPDPANGVPGDLGQTLCDSSGNCDVQTALIYNEVSSRIFFVPYRGYQTIGQKENTAVSNYNSLQVSFRHPFGHGLTLQTSYTWAHMIDDSTNTYFQTGVDDSHLSRWRATSDLNRTHVLMINYVYDLPFFRNSTNSILRNYMGGWQLSGISSFFTGQPVDFSCGVNGFSSGVGQGVRCNSLGKLQIKKGTINNPDFGPVPGWYDPAVVGQVTFDQLRADGQPGMFGYMGRNPLTGPGRNNFDLALLKNFSLPWVGGERSGLQFRLETFNTFNHPQWSGINAGCDGSIPFGQPCYAPGLGLGEVSGAWNPRVIQLGLAFNF